MKKFPANSKVCFIGDSITHNNNFVSHIAVHYHKHFHAEHVQFINCGVSGGDTKLHLAILDEDALSYHPTHAVILLGINDSARYLLEEERSKERHLTLVKAFEEYKKNINLLCNRLVAAGVQVILCTPAPYDEYTTSETPPQKGGYALMAGYAEYIREYARISDIALCDFHTYITKKLQEESLYAPDHVHLNEKGQYYMAKCFLEAQNIRLEPMMPFPEYITQWHAKVIALRNIYVTEHKIINDFTLNLQDRLAAIDKYLSTDHTDEPDAAYLEGLIAQYKINKPLQEELKAYMNTFFLL